MNKIRSTHLLVLLGLTSCSISLQAGIPLWTFQPLTPTQLSISPNESAQVRYAVTNQSSKAQTLALQNIQGIQQLTGAGLCSNPFVLPTQGSTCILSLQINGSELTHPLSDGPIVCRKGSALQCYRPDPDEVLNIKLVDNATQLSIPPTATIPASLSAISSSITVTNIGPYPAYNVSARLPSTWNAVIQDHSNCAVLLPDAPNNTCTITFSSNQAYLAQGHIVVTGTNVINPPSMAIAFTVAGYLVWDVSFAGVQVIDQSDRPTSPETWGGYLTPIGSTAQSFTEGKDNTSAIVSALGAGSYAAQSCYSSTSGGFFAHTWYLPALCQMGEGSNCSPGFANINTNLAQLGFGNLGAGYYWSSTESALNPDLNAWQQIFDAHSNQNAAAKFHPYGVRCAREMTIS